MLNLAVFGVVGSGLLRKAVSHTQTEVCLGFASMQYDSRGAEILPRPGEPLKHCLEESVWETLVCQRAILEPSQPCDPSLSTGICDILHASVGNRLCDNSGYVYLRAFAKHMIDYDGWILACVIAFIVWVGSIARSY